MTDQNLQARNGRNIGNVGFSVFFNKASGGLKTLGVGRTTIYEAFEAPKLCAIPGGASNGFFFNTGSTEYTGSVKFVDDQGNEVELDTIALSALGQSDLELEGGDAPLVLSPGEKVVVDFAISTPGNNLPFYFAGGATELKTKQSRSGFSDGSVVNFTSVLAPGGSVEFRPPKGYAWGPAPLPIFGEAVTAQGGWSVNFGATDANLVQELVDGDGNVILSDADVILAGATGELDVVEFLAEAGAVLTHDVYARFRAQNPFPANGRVILKATFNEFDLAAEG